MSVAGKILAEEVVGDNELSERQGSLDYNTRTGRCLHSFY